MQIVIHPVGMDVTEGLKDYINQRLNKYFKNHTYITNIEVYAKVATERAENTHIIEAIVHVPGPEIYAESSAETHDIALNDTIDKLKRQLEKYKDKMQFNRA